MKLKFHKRIPPSLFFNLSHRPHEPALPESIRSQFHSKSVSGNQAMYSYNVVKALVKSPDVQTLFALSKYGCCCCLEERTWIAALHSIGYGQQALDNNFMFEAWGGTVPDQCQSSMNNAVLAAPSDNRDASNSSSSSLCYRYEHVMYRPNNRTNSNSKFKEELYFWGNETWAYLRRAKHVGGFLFARKFNSNNPNSIRLLHDIRDKLWLEEEPGGGAGYE
jgi:hypothetical protein